MHQLYGDLQVSLLKVWLRHSELQTREGIKVQNQSPEGSILNSCLSASSSDDFRDVSKSELTLASHV